MDDDGGHLIYPHRLRHAKKRFRKAAEEYVRARLAGESEHKWDLLCLAYRHLERVRG